jgi:hypothetical protein
VSSGEENGSDDERTNGAQATQRKSMATRNDEDFEKANAEKVKRSMTQKQAQTGVSRPFLSQWHCLNGSIVQAAEAGVISRLELHNFMCHK